MLLFFIITIWLYINRHVSSPLLIPQVSVSPSTWQRLQILYQCPDTLPMGPRKRRYFSRNYMSILLL